MGMCERNIQTVKIKPNGKVTQQISDFIGRFSCPSTHPSA
jgi:hypothetical protein